MSPLTRRAFLELSTATLAGALARASGQDPPHSPGPIPSLRTAFLMARLRGRPLLVLVIPDERTERARRRTFWMEHVIEEGSDEVRADMALCDLVCAMWAEVGAQLPEEYRAALDLRAIASPERPLAGSFPWALVVETDAPTVRALDLEWVDASDAGTRLLERQVRGAVLPDENALERRAQQARAARGQVWPERIVRGRREAERSRDREREIGRFARRWGPELRPTRPAMGPAPPPCGSRVVGPDGVERPTPPCGTAHVPPLSARFLDLYTSR